MAGSAISVRDFVTVMRDPELASYLRIEERELEGSGSP
jgi:hypothetical protein